MEDMGSLEQENKTLGSRDAFQIVKRVNKKG
jgi:hypothetical protein